MTSLRLTLLAFSLVIFACSTDTPISDNDQSDVILNFVQPPRERATSLTCIVSVDDEQGGDQFTLPQGGELLSFPTKEDLILRGLSSEIAVSCTALDGSKTVGTTQGSANIDVHQTTTLTLTFTP